MGHYIRVFNSLLIVTDWNQELLNLYLTPFAIILLASPSKEALRDLRSRAHLVTHHTGRNTIYS